MKMQTQARTRVVDRHRSRDRVGVRWRQARRWRHRIWTTVRTALGAAGLFILSTVAPGCSAGSGDPETPPETQRPTRAPPAPAPVSSDPSAESTPALIPVPRDEETGDEAKYSERRRRMVEQQLRARDITDPRVLDAMERVPRHRFVPVAVREMAYADGPLPIGHDQTISQPYIVALMTQLVRPQLDSRSLDVGTGSGYQAAVLASLVRTVYSIEILPALADEARQRLKTLGYDNIEVRCGDGYRGWPEQAPFDLIIVAAAPSHVPQPLIDQLAPGGRLVIPVGTVLQKLMVVEKKADGSTVRRTVAPVSFVPMTGEARQDSMELP